MPIVRWADTLSCMRRVGQVLALANMSGINPCTLQLLVSGVSPWPPPVHKVKDRIQMILRIAKLRSDLRHQNLSFFRAPA